MRSAAWIVSLVFCFSLVQGRKISIPDVEGDEISVLSDYADPETNVTNERDSKCKLEHFKNFNQFRMNVMTEFCFSFVLGGQIRQR